MRIFCARRKKIILRYHRLQSQGEFYFFHQRQAGLSPIGCPLPVWSVVRGTHKA
jgi:hypothetical protein